MKWYETAFRKEYLDVYYRRDDDAAVDEAKFAAQVMGLPDNSFVLDVACGGGRHARALAELGHRVVGTDLSRDLLHVAAESTACVRSDMRALPFPSSFDAAVSFFTSFGYFDDEGNQATLDGIARAIRPGGAYLLDFLNAVAVQRHLVPESEEDRDGKRFLARRRIEDGRVLKDVTIEDEGVTLSYTESVRLYHHHDLVNMLRDAGMNVVATYGAFDGRDFTTDAPRCIVVAQKAWSG